MLHIATICLSGLGTWNKAIITSCWVQDPLDFEGMICWIQRSSFEQRYIYIYPSGTPKRSDMFSIVTNCRKEQNCNSEGNQLQLQFWSKKNVDFVSSPVGKLSMETKTCSQNNELPTFPPPERKKTKFSTSILYEWCFVALTIGLSRN